MNRMLIAFWAFGSAAFAQSDLKTRFVGIQEIVIDGQVAVLNEDYTYDISKPQGFKITNGERLEKLVEKIRKVELIPTSEKLYPPYKFNSKGAYSLRAKTKKESFAVFMVGSQGLVYENSYYIVRNSKELEELNRLIIEWNGKSAD